MSKLSSNAIHDPQAFDERLRNVPQAPGVYLWKDANGKILYVGKSKSLRERMRSYFGAPRGLSGKTRRLVAQIADFDYILTTTELEALVLEMNLIKQHRPKYNVLLKDDKSYPYIKITLQETWPRIFTTRKVLDDGARYFGPFASAGSVRATLKLLNKLFHFRPPFDCSDVKFERHRKAGKPCMYYDIRRCLGPCVPGLTSVEEYRKAISDACLFLEGKSEQILRELRHKMQQAADTLEFERAAYLRDQIAALEKVLERQRVLKTGATDQDVIAFAREDGSAVVQVFFVRGGKLIGAEPFTLEGTDDTDSRELITQFLTQFYDSAASIPSDIVLAEHPEEAEIIERWLEQKGGHRVSITVPRRGEKKQLLDLAARNAAQKLDELRLKWLNTSQRAIGALTELQQLLDLPGLPHRIECYDISNTQGTHTVGAMVVFVGGAPRKSDYRRFKIKTVAGANDVAALQEVLRRRFRRAQQAQGELVAIAHAGDAHQPPPDLADASDPAALADPRAEGQEVDERWAELPDLIIVDGGKPQANAAQAVLDELGFGHLPVVGAAKGPNRDRFDLQLPGAPAPIVLPRSSTALHLVQQIDEEAHRFAISYHRNLRGKATFASPLAEIPGIGPKRKQALLKRFGSLDAMRQASVEELAAVPGMTHRAAEELKRLL
ncbi:excinuclease ABC subunit UvrC [Kallotenue papyrolyticum]|uniref:excinuclease ABC subunit UvrC n=1 Tax=Kallotenue papyrolyticum TaxID=1325125 RepID=UPI00047861FB|nr:excinuclease ABC subunit UvrC [Kallotenue papyrolyticum]